MTVAGFLALAWLIAYLEREVPSGEPGRARVVDGDSLELHGLRIRLAGIDAPELTQTCIADRKIWDCGRQARQALRFLTAGNVHCDFADTDIYNRWLARCFRGQMSVNAAMVKRGWAVNTGGYGAEEKRARANKSGIWRGDFERPAQWRAAQRDGYLDLSSGWAALSRWWDGLTNRSGVAE